MAAILGPDPAPPGPPDPPDPSTPQNARGWLYGLLAGLLVGGGVAVSLGLFSDGDDRDRKALASLSSSEIPVTTTSTSESSAANGTATQAPAGAPVAGSGRTEPTTVTGSAPATPGATVTSAPRVPAADTPGTMAVPASSRRVCVDQALDYPSPNLSGMSLDQARTALAAHAANKAALIGVYASCVRDGGDIDPRHSKNRGDSQYCGSDVSKWQDNHRYEHTMKTQKQCMQELTFRRDFDGTSNAPMPPTTATTRPAQTTTTTKPPTTTTTRKPYVTSLASAGWQKAKPKLTPEEAGAVSRASGECNGVDVCVWDVTLKAGFDHLASSICAKAAEAIKAEGVVFGSSSPKYDGIMNNVAIHSPTKVTPIHNCR